MKKTIAQELGMTKFPFDIRDDRGNVIYLEYDDGYWARWEWDSEGRVIYYENSYSFWAKREYNEKGNEIYFENSKGQIKDNRPQPAPQPQPEPATPIITLQHCIDRGFTLEKVYDKVYKEKHGKDYKICYLKLSKLHMIDYCVDDGMCEVYKLDREGTILERKTLKNVNDFDFYIRFLASQKRLRKLPKF